MQYCVRSHTYAHAGVRANIAIALHRIGVKNAGHIPHKQPAIQRLGNGSRPIFIFHIAAGFRQQSVAGIKTGIGHRRKQ
ncbi:hypothetical protein D3C80_1766940 [compost metagenome]